MGVIPFLPSIDPEPPPIDIHDDRDLPPPKGLQGLSHKLPPSRKNESERNTEEREKGEKEKEINNTDKRERENRDNELRRDIYETTKYNGLQVDWKDFSTPAPKKVRFHRNAVSRTQHIPSRHSYTQREKNTIWTSIKDLKINAKRNTIEYKYDGWNFCDATEESNMIIDPRTG